MIGVPEVDTLDIDEDHETRDKTMSGGEGSNLDRPAMVVAMVVYGSLVAYREILGQRSSAFFGCVLVAAAVEESRADGYANLTSANQDV